MCARDDSVYACVDLTTKYEWASGENECVCSTLYQTLVVSDLALIKNPVCTFREMPNLLKSKKSSGHYGSPFICCAFTG